MLRPDAKKLFFTGRSIPADGQLVDIVLEAWRGSNSAVEVQERPLLLKAGF